MARDEILSCRHRAAFGQDLIILGAANAVGVAVDDDGVFRDARIGKSECNPVKFAARSRSKLSRVELKVYGVIFERPRSARLRRRRRDPAHGSAGRHGALRIEGADHLVD
jgi:hypothetical protein